MNKKKLLTFVIPILAVALVSAIGYYALMTFTININQPIVTSGIGPQSIDCDAGETCMGDLIRIDNTGNIPKTITITDNNIDPNIELNYVGTIELDNKESATWTRISDSMKGDFYYMVTGEMMGFHVESEGLNPNTEYSVVYYIDSGPTDPVDGKPWNLANSEELATGTTDSLGVLEIDGGADLGNLPFNTDYNSNPNVDDSYCNGENGFDSYLHCNGGKIWILPKSDFDAVAWNPAEWLFEAEDLIRYFKNANGEYVIGAGSYVEFYPLVQLDPYVSGGTLDIEITIA